MIFQNDTDWSLQTNTHWLIITNCTDWSFANQNYSVWSFYTDPRWLIFLYQPSGRTSVVASSSTKPSRENSKSPLPSISTTRTVKWSPRRAVSVRTVLIATKVSTLRVPWDRRMGISTHRWTKGSCSWPWPCRCPCLWQHSHSHLSYQHETNHSKTLT